MTALTPTAQGASSRRATVRWLVGAALAAILVATVLPALSGVDWATVISTLGSISPAILAGLLVLWALGLLSHTITLTAALPSLTHRRALTLSLTGSALSNILPMGGAAGIALNYRMIRGWGFSRAQFSAYTLVSNVWDVLTKLVLPAVAVPLVLSRVGVPPQVVVPLTVTAALFAVVCLIALVLVGSRRATDRLGRALDRALAPALRLLRTRREIQVRPALVDLQQSCNHVVRQGWLRLTAGMAIYTSLLFALLAACLVVTGSGLGLAAIAGGFAVERLLTLAGLTPGGAGFVEVGLTAALLALGGNPEGVVAGVLLFRAITFLLEIPVGGAWIIGWLWSRRSNADVDEPTDPVLDRERTAA